MAISSYGVTLKYGSASADKEIVIKNFPSLLGKRSSLETTTLSDDAQTFIPGIRQQEDSFDFTANYDKTVYAELNELEGEMQKCELEFSDGSKYAWDGYISVSANDGDVDSVVEMTVSITPATVPVWSAGA